jgi:drug efflux transport system permease protein
MRSILHFIKKEFLQFKRDPKMFGMILVAPIIQLIFLGLAANLDVDNVKTIVYDMDKSYTSRNFIEKFTSSGYFQIKEYANNYDEVTNALDNAEVIFALVIPPDFEEKINRRETVKVQALFDGSDGNSASISAGYAQGITAEYSKNILVDFLRRSGAIVIPASNINAKVRVWYNPTLKTRNYMVPAIVGLLVTLITLILTSLAVVKEREIGTMEQLIVTPLKPYQMIIGKLVPFMVLGFVSVLIVLIAMTLIFNIPIKGSVTFLFFSSFLYILSTLGLGLFVSTISKTQQQAMMISIFAVMMPMIYLSGFAFPIENMPEIIQYISYIIPLRYFITIIRGIILKGTGFAELWGNVLVLFLMGVAILAISSLQFKKRLE